MLLKAAILIVSLLLLPQYKASTDPQIVEKSLYLEKLTELYRKLGLSGDAAGQLARRLVLMGMLSDVLNAGIRSPREEITVRDVQVSFLSEQDGSFEASVLVDSLQNSLEYCILLGTADFSAFLAHVTSLKPLSLSLYEGGKLSRNPPFNNGSKGTTITFNT